MKKKAKHLHADPIFGVDALAELAKKASVKIKPFPKLKDGPHRRFKSTEHCREIMRYLYAEQDE